jgi:hypothetical protein
MNDLLSYTQTRLHELGNPDSHFPHHFPLGQKRYRHQSCNVQIPNVRLSVPSKMIFPRETPPLVRTPLHAAEKLMRFEWLVDFLVSLQIFGSDEAFATVYADAISWAMPAGMVAARYRSQQTEFLSEYCVARFQDLLSF